jgi:hypothetical protein
MRWENYAAAPLAIDCGTAEDVVAVLKESFVGQSEGTVSYRRARKWGRNEIAFRTSGTVHLWLTCQEHSVGPMAGYCGVRLGIAA